jgi:DNA-binding response OmpR family regulator
MTTSKIPAKILVVEDDRNIAALVDNYLVNAGFRTVIARDGNAGLAAARREAPDLIVLDLNLPGLDGAELCREIRRDSQVPILMLTARAEEIDRIVGFSLGADDYVVKPFSPRELVERIKAILRRTRARSAGGDAGDQDGGTLRHGVLVLEREKHKLTRDGETVKLTPSEYKLLEALMGRPGRVFTRDELLDRLYQHGETVVERVVDVHLSKLRQKIETDAGNPRHIHTVHGVGYRFAEPDED